MVDVIPVELSGLVKLPTFVPASEDELELDLTRALPVLNSSPEVLELSLLRFVRVVTSCNPETLCIL